MQQITPAKKNVAYRVKPILARRIREERLRSHLTQEELGERAGTGRSLIATLESGKVESTGTEGLKKIADALEVRPDYLAGWTDISVYESEGDLEWMTIQARMREMLALLEQLPKEDRELVLQMARRLRGASEPRIIGDLDEDG